MPKEILSEDLDRDPDAAMQAAMLEPVIVLENGEPVLVLVSNAEYERLTCQKTVLPDAASEKSEAHD